MRRLAIVVGTIAALALCPGVASAAGINGKYRAKIRSGLLAGTWTIDFKTKGSKGTYKVTSRFGTLTVWMRFKGSTVTFYRESEGSICPTKDGRYRYKITGTKLKFTKLSDPCKERAMVHSPTYRKIG